MSKGIAPIVASVLLVAVSLAVVSIFSGWAPNLAEQVTESTENNTQLRLDCNRASLEVISAKFYSSNTEVAVRNTGRQKLNNVTIVGFTSDDVILGNNETSLGDGEITSTNVSTGSEPAYIEVYSKKCGDVTDKLEEIS